MKTHTYAEACGEKPFDWNKALAGLSDGVQPDNMEELIDKSSEWVTCACGNQCSIIPRSVGGMPKDDTLAVLGAIFYEDVYGLRFSGARDALEKIENRSAELIKEIKSSSDE